MNPVNENKVDPIMEAINYSLPEDRIARYPLDTRHDSRLLVYNDGQIQDAIFRNVTEFLPDNSLLVFNDTRVIRARFFFRKSTGAEIEIFCLEPYEPSDYESAFAKTGSVKWKCLVGNLKKWKNEILEKKIELNNRTIFIRAKKIENHQEYQVIEFNYSDEKMSFSELLELAGETPIPPYLNRASEPMDHDRYQTIYANTEGSVAAPTAGLHFTPEILKNISDKGLKRIDLTLHVGAGTFRPILTDSVKDHAMHSEHFSISRQALETLVQHNGNVIAIGTTSVRTLESLYYCGTKLLMNSEFKQNDLHVGQWDWQSFDGKNRAGDSLNAVLQYMIRNNLAILNASTQLMILPGYKFKLIDGLITNFHQPGSTLLLLVNAFIGDDWKKVYEHALINNYRFLSYGDSSLLLNPRLNKEVDIKKMSKMIK